MNIQSVTNCKILLTYSELKILRDICRVVSGEATVCDDDKTYARIYADMMDNYIKKITLEQFGE